MKKLLPFLLVLVFGCTSSSDDSSEMGTDDMDDTPVELDIYFPPTTSEDWETLTLNDLDWDENAAEDLKQFLMDSDTKAFMILKNGRIVMEEYFNGHTASNNNLWFSAGKTLTAYTIGIAEQEGYLSIDDSSSQYLGGSWTSMTVEQESAITIRNQLTMTSGGDYTINDWNCTTPECLNYLNNPGEFWFYHNAFYTLLQPVVNNAVPDSFDNYFDEKLKTVIGMDGTWLNFGFNRVYASTARSMARFGILNLNNGNWNGQQILNTNYFTAMTSTSQEENKSYGYLWWLNGKESHRLPSGILEFEGTLIPNAPDDLFAGLGANDQKLYVVPSKDLVVVRLGNSAESDILGPSGFDNDLWERINELMSE